MYFGGGLLYRQYTGERQTAFLSAPHWSGSVLYASLPGQGGFAVPGVPALLCAGGYDPPSAGKRAGQPERRGRRKKKETKMKNRSQNKEQGEEIFPIPALYF